MANVSVDGPGARHQALGLNACATPRQDILNRPITSRHPTPSDARRHTPLGYCRTAAIVQPCCGGIGDGIGTTDPFSRLTAMRAAKALAQFVADGKPPPGPHRLEILDGDGKVLFETEIA